MLRYSWDFGDGTTADIVNPTKTYLQGGVYPVTLSVEDDFGFPGHVHSDRILVRVDESPIADAGPDQLACASTEVTFDGSALARLRRRRQPLHLGLRRRRLAAAASGRCTSSPSPASYRVVLTIDGDEIGQCANTNSDEMSVKVVDAPMASIVAPASIGVGATASFDASGSTTASGRIVDWHWDFGDGAMAKGATVEHSLRQARQIRGRR